MAEAPGPGSHFLGMFDENGHSNFGNREDWGDAARFEAEALEILAERLGARAVEVPARFETPPPPVN